VKGSGENTERLKKEKNQGLGKKGGYRKTVTIAVLRRTLRNLGKKRGTGGRKFKTQPRARWWGKGARIRSRVVLFRKK